MTKRNILGRVTCLSGAAFLAASLYGCGVGNGITADSTSTAGAARPHFTGSVFGGQQPVSGATIQLYAVGTTGKASPATALIASTVTSDTGGNFNITGKYDCASATQVYLVATGGNAGSGINGALTMMAALGPCSALTPSTFISMNELTTIAAAYALAPFATDITHVGAIGSDPSGLVNAFVASKLLIDTATGQPSIVPAGMTLPVTRMNTLGDILAACVNSSGAGSDGCSALFAATGAIDTLGAAFALARHPGSTASVALWALATPTSPFVPALSSQPKDLTLAVNYGGQELSTPYGIALDSAGSAWVTNEAGFTVTKLSALSTSFATTSYGGLLAPRGISIDTSGNLWIANTGGNNVMKLNSAGTILSGGGFATGGIAAPVAIANDSSGNAWIANFNGNSITELSPTGTASAGSPITGAGTLSAPSAIALDASGRVSVANAGTGQLCIFSNNGTLQGCGGDGVLYAATGIAVNNTGALALSGSRPGATTKGAFTLANNSGSVDAASPITGGGLDLPMAVAYDGGGVTWFANSASISAFSGAVALSPVTGIGSLSSPAGIAVDASGNVWTTNSGDNSISVFIGLASPVVTPLAAN